MKKIFFFLFILTVEIQSSTAQNINEDNLAGKMQYGVPGHPWSDLFKTLISRSPGKKYYDILCHTAEKICTTIAKPPVVNPPRGFNIKPFAGGNVVILPFPGGIKGFNVTFCDYPLYIDKKTRQVKQSGTWGSSIRLYINDPEMLFNYSYQLESDCDTAGVPEFAFKPAMMHRDKNGFWVTEDVKNLKQVRIVKKKGVPLYAPVTQKEYLEFEIKFEQKDLIHCKKELAYDKELAAKHPQDEIAKNDIHLSEENVANTIKAIRDYQKSLNTMSPEQLLQPAYTSRYFFGPKGHYYFDLVPPSYKGAVEMARLNPQYFDKTLPSGTTQLIVVATAYSTRSASPDMIRKLKTWFGQIDYQQLQSLIR